MTSGSAGWIAADAGAAAANETRLDHVPLEAIIRAQIAAALIPDRPMRDSNHRYSGNVGADEERIFDAIIGMSPEDRTWTYTVLRRVDDNQWPKFADKLDDFCAFFEHDNPHRLARWGSGPKNPDQVRVVDRTLSLGVRQVELAGAGSRTALSPGMALGIEIPEWPVTSRN